MEKIHKPFVEKLLRKHIKGLRGNPIFTGFNGKRDKTPTDRTGIRNKIYDEELNTDVICNIECDNNDKDIIKQLLQPDKELVQVKISSRDNFREFGKDRKSFVIGNVQEIRNRLLSKLITGYDLLGNGILCPYVMLDCRVLFTAITEDNRFMIYPKGDPRNIKTDDTFKGQWIYDNNKKPWLWMAFGVLDYINWKYGNKLIISKNVPKDWRC